MKVCFDSAIRFNVLFGEFSDEAAYGDEECNNSWIFRDFSKNYRLYIQDVKDCYILYAFVSQVYVAQLWFGCNITATAS